MSSNTKPKILVVDDQAINVKLLQHKLERAGMDVMAASNGRECLETVARVFPDLILLDVMMPEMDGIEVCRRLKNESRTQAIPVIFITARSSKEGKLEGLGVGAIDYITKPIDLDETLARVRTQLRIQRIHRENLELHKRLADARQSATIGAITQGIAHNLNNLLGVAVGYLDLMKSGFDNVELVKRSTVLMDKSIHRMVNIVRQLSAIATKERPRMAPITINNLITGCLDRIRDEFQINLVASIDCATSDIEVETNVEIFENILGKLLLNAWESYPESADGKRHLLLETEVLKRSDSRRLVVKVIDCGRGIDPEIADHIFEPFVSSDSAVGRGMGLTIARHGIRNLGGELAVRPRPNGGTCAVLTHPLPDPEPIVSKPEAEVATANIA